MPEAWEQDTEEESWSDREGWRGALHQERGDAAWLGELEAAWEPEDATTSDEDDWQREPEQADWPEDMAGPEYWLFKRDGL